MRAKYTVGDVLQVVKQYKQACFPLEQYTIVSVDTMGEDGGHAWFIYRFLRTQETDVNNLHKYGCLPERLMDEHFVLLTDRVPEEARFSVKLGDMFKAADTILNINTVYIASGAPMVDYSLVESGVATPRHAGYIWFLNYLKENKFVPDAANFKRRGQPT